jgi:cytochrome c oxidase cbb3-type subunit 3
VVAATLALTACEREKRDYYGPPPPSTPQVGVSPTSLQAGGSPAPAPIGPETAKYENNAFHLSEGQRYYEWYNCYGCHAAGGGDIGPALMDDAWRYGGELSQIHASIAEGRPNGMPAFRDRIPDEQIWEIAAYVRSMSGNADKLAASSRADEIQTSEPKTQVNRTPIKPVAPTDQPEP